MPYTLSHPAAVLPFSRWLGRWRLLSATVIGSMVPDFGLFLPWRPPRADTHTSLALVTFCLPVGLATYWIFQTLIKTAVLEVLPEGAYARSRPLAAPARLSDLGQWVRAACGVLLGAVTHLVWDGFTHEGARGVRLFPILDDPIPGFGGHHLDAVRALQDLGSLVGLIVVVALAAYALRPGHDPAIPGRPLAPPQRRRWLLAYLIAAVAFSAAFYARLRLVEIQPHFMMVRAAEIAVGLLRGLAAALLLVSVALQWRLRAARYGSSGPER